MWASTKISRLKAKSIRNVQFYAKSHRTSPKIISKIFRGIWKIFLEKIYCSIFLICWTRKIFCTLTTSLLTKSLGERWKFNCQNSNSIETYPNDVKMTLPPTATKIQCQHYLREVAKRKKSAKRGGVPPVRFCFLIIQSILRRFWCVHSALSNLLEINKNIPPNFSNYPSCQVD